MKNFDQLQQEFETSFSTGLSEKASFEKLARYRAEKHELKKKTPHCCIRFIKEVKLTDGIQLTLWLACILSLIAYCLQKDNSYIVSLLITIIVALFILIGACVAWKRYIIPYTWNDGSLDKMRTTQVKRDGEWKNIASYCYLVPGDIVKVQAGVKVPADIILFESHEMKVNNKALTGEADDVSRDAN